MASEDVKDTEGALDLFTQFNPLQPTLYYDDPSEKMKIDAAINKVMDDDSYRPLMNQTLTKQQKADIYCSSKPESMILIAQTEDNMEPDQIVMEGFQIALNDMDIIFIYLDRLRVAYNSTEDVMGNIMHAVRGLSKVYKMTQKKLSEIKENIQYFCIYTSFSIY